MKTPEQGLCWNGDRRFGVYQDTVTLRSYCSVCAANVIKSSINAHRQFLSDLIPYAKGERVECWTVGTQYDGCGIVQDVSTELRHGGTEEYPAYLVKLESTGEQLWYTPICLKRTKGESVG
jgi:hypothetical protein